MLRRFTTTLKGNAALAKSPTETVRTQSNQLFHGYLTHACRLEFELA